MRLAPFDQSVWLGVMADIAKQQDACAPAEHGMCLGLCILWLRQMQDPTRRTPTERMDALRSQLHLAVTLQAKYEAEALKAAVTASKDAALAAGLSKAGGRFGLSFEEQTVVQPARVGMIGMLRRMQQDLEEPNSRVLWGFAGEPGAHAIAAVNNSGKDQTTTDRGTIHVFDPNNGEYVFQMQELPMVVQDMHRHCPFYARFAVMKRRSVSFIDDLSRPEPRTDGFAFTSEKQRR
jgi:hypothetical protein